MCKVISAISYKGGVGKTTSAVNISSYLQMQGKRVCTVDLDPQHNLSRHFGILPGHLKNRPTIYDSFVQPVHKVIFPDRDNRYRNVVIDNEKESIYCFSADIDFGSSVLSE